MKPRLFEKYNNEIISEMMKKFGYKNKMQVPAIEKIVINMGVGKGADDIKILDDAVNELAQITGQKPIVTKAKKSIANFKIRAGNPVGCKVTLRREKMYEFLDRMINVAIPRIRDFRGVSEKAFDKRGNYSLGLAEQTIFPEINHDKVKRTQGMDVVIVVKNSSKKESYELLRLFGLPFRKTRI